MYPGSSSVVSNGGVSRSTTPEARLTRWARTASIARSARARDAALWDAAEHLVSTGVPADTITASLEWVGTHADLPARPGLPARDGSVMPGIMSMFPDSAQCFVVSPNPGLDLPIVDEVAYRRWAVAGSGVMYVYEQDPCR